MPTWPPPSATAVSGTVPFAGRVRTRSAVAPTTLKSCCERRDSPGGPRAGVSFQVPRAKLTRTSPGRKSWRRRYRKTPPPSDDHLERVVAERDAAAAEAAEGELVGRSGGAVDVDDRVLVELGAAAREEGDVDEGADVRCGEVPLVDDIAALRSAGRQPGERQTCRQDRGVHRDGRIRLVGRQGDDDRDLVQVRSRRRARPHGTRRA